MTRLNGDKQGQLLFLLVALLWIGGAPQVGAQASTNADKVAVMINLAATYQSSGQHQRAEQLLQEAVDLAKSSGDRHALVLAKSKLGAACTMTRQLNRAESLLRESLEMARADGNSHLAAAILNDLGNVLGLRQKYAEALAAFQE